MLITATQLRVGMLLEMDGALDRVMKMQHITPGNWRGMVQTTLRNLQSGSKMEKRFRSTDKVDRATVDAQEMEFLYADGDQYVFMHPVTYEQTTLTKELLEDSLSYIVPNMRVTIDTFDDRPIGVTLTMTVELRIVETETGLREAT